MKKKDLLQRIEDLEKEVWFLKHKDDKAKIEHRSYDNISGIKEYDICYINKDNKIYQRAVIWANKYELPYILEENEKKIIIGLIDKEYNTEPKIFEINKQTGKGEQILEKDIKFLEKQFKKIKVKINEIQNK